jgi:hypothetical protein
MAGLAHIQKECRFSSVLVCSWLLDPNVSTKSTSPRSRTRRGEGDENRTRANLLAAVVGGGEDRGARDLDEQPSEVGKGSVRSHQ